MFAYYPDIQASPLWQIKYETKTSQPLAQKDSGSLEDIERRLKALREGYSHFRDELNYGREH